MAHHAIYVPGLGDQRTFRQNWAIKTWWLYGLRPHYFPLYWADKEAFAPKLELLLARIESYQQNGHQVSLIAASAGAGAAINAFARHKKLTGIVLICGKIHNPQVVEDRFYLENPAFKESAYQVEASLKKLTLKDRQKIMSIHPIVDNSVPIGDTVIKGALEKKIPTRGHFFSISYALTFGTPIIARFLRRTGV